jgi:hypothetical protein
MWNKLSNIASEAIEAAKDIKHHISEVTSEEFETEKKPEQEEDILEALAKENILLKSKLKEILEDSGLEKKILVAENKKLNESVKILENALVEKEKESLWEAENFQREIQEILKAKNKVQRELEKITEEMINKKSSENHSSFLEQEVEKMRVKVKNLEIEVKHLQGEKEEWRKRYENYTKAEQDKVSRSFFIEFLADYLKVEFNSVEKEKLMKSLVDVLHLNKEEMKVLNLVKEDDEKEGTLFDKFNKFLTDFSGN